MQVFFDAQHLPDRIADLHILQTTNYDGGLSADAQPLLKRLSAAKKAAEDSHFVAERRLGDTDARPHAPSVQAEAELPAASVPSVDANPAGRWSHLPLRWYKLLVVAGSMFISRGLQLMVRRYNHKEGVK